MDEAPNPIGAGRHPMPHEVVAPIPVAVVVVVPPDGVLACGQASFGDQVPNPIPLGILDDECDEAGLIETEADRDAARCR